MKYEEHEKEKSRTYKKVPVHQLINFDDNSCIKVSVVVPVFNVETYLPQCLDSILSQTLEDIEVICVNDGSTDNSLKILREYSLNDKRIKIIDKDNAGYGHTINIGMDMAKGEYIAIVESDDYILPDMLETLYITADENNLDFVKSDYYRFYGEGNSFIKEYFQTDPTGEYYGKTFSTSENQETYKFLMNTWTGLYKSVFLRKNNIRHFETPGASYQDNGFWFKTFFYGKRVMLVNQAFYMYRRDNPNSSVKNKEKVYAMDKEYDLINDFLDKSGNKKAFLKALTLARYNNFHFTMDRIDLEFKKEFLKSTSDIFNRMKTDGELEPDLLEENDLHTLYRIMEDPDKYYNYMYEINTDNYEYYRKFLECRIDIKNCGDESNDVFFLDYDDPLCIISQPKWYQDNYGVGSIVNSLAGNLSFSFRCVGDGNLELNFRAFDYRDRNHRRVELYIDYTEIIVNEEVLVTGSKVTWCDDPFVYKRSVNDGEIINVQISWKPLNIESNLKTQTDNEKIEDVFSQSRIDIKNDGKEDNRVHISGINDARCEITQPSWLKNSHGIGTVISTSSNDLEFMIECIGDGKLSVNFRAVDYRDRKGNRIPIIIVYNSIVIDGKTLVSAGRITWHDDPYTYQTDVKDGQLISVKLKWSHLYQKNIQQSPYNERNLNYLRSIEDMKELEIIQLHEELERLNSENNKFKDFKEEALNSTSWKLTKPLRKIKHLK